MQLRYYQEESIRSIFDYFAESSGNPIIALPTGSGKSVVIAGFLKEVYASYPTQRIMMLTHVRELIEQNYDKLLTMWPCAPAGVYSAGLNKRQAHYPITFAGIQSVVKKAKLFGHIDMVIIDEAHLVGTATTSNYIKFLSALREINPRIVIVGLTATPYRMKGGDLTACGIFTDICYDITRGDSFARLVDEGYLCPLITRRTKVQVDVSKVKIQGGDYNRCDIEKILDAKQLTNKIIRECQEYRGTRKQWLIFCAGIEHAVHVAQTLDAIGISAEPFHSKMKKDRGQVLDGYRNNDFQVLVTSDMATTGLDVCGIDLIIMLRPTRSPGLWVQMVGRGLRVAPGKDNCLVLDFVGNTARLGPVNNVVIPAPPGKKKLPGEAPVKVCDECQAYSPAGVRYCTDCGNEFPAPESKLQSESTDALLIIKSDTPTPPVDHQVLDVKYKHHVTLAEKKSLRVTYYTDTGKRISEYRSFTGSARKHTTLWWQDRTRAPVPTCVDDAMLLTELLMVPQSIQVDETGKYRNIIGYTFYG